MSESERSVPGVNRADLGVERALAESKRAEILTIALAVSIFLLIAVVLAMAYWIETPVLMFGGLALGAVFHRAIKQVLMVRRNHRVLQSLSLIVRVLPPEEAALEVMARIR